MNLYRIIAVVIIAFAGVFGFGAVKVNLHKITDSDIRKVYHQLAINSGSQEIPDLVILKSGIVNAWTDGEHITITTGLVSKMTNENELAMVLGHELAHALNHDMERVTLDSRDIEAHADKLGAFIMMRAGYNVCEGKEIFRVFKELFGDAAVTTSHPDSAYRLDQLNLPQCQ